MADKIEDERQKIVKRVKFEDLTPAMQAIMLAPTEQKKKRVPAPKPAAEINQQMERIQEPAMTLERAKMLMSDMNKAEKLKFLKEIVANDNHLIRGRVVVAIGQSAMADMKPRDKREFLDFVAQDAARKKHERELRRANPPSPAMVAQDVLVDISAEDHVAATAKATPKPKRSACRANGTKPKDKSKKHHATVPPKNKAARPKDADMPPEAQPVEVVVAEIIQPEIIQTGVKDDNQQQIAPGTVVSTAPTKFDHTDLPYQGKTGNTVIAKKAEPEKSVHRRIQPDVNKKPEKAKSATVARVNAISKTPVPVPVKEIVASEFEEVKIVAKGSSTSIVVGSQTFILKNTKLVKMFDGSIKLELAAQKVVVGNTVPLPKKANEFEMMFGFETKTEVEDVNSKPWLGKVMLVADADNFTRYVRYQDRVSMTDIAKYYINGREMLVRPQYFVSCMHVPSPHVHSFRDQYAHRIKSAGYFNVDWTRIRETYEDDSMFDPNYPISAKDRPRGYGDADVARFILQQDNLDKFETLLLLTHDHHFTSTVKYLRSIGKKVELYHTGRWCTSPDLRKSCDSDTDISERFAPEYPENILNEIERRKTKY